MRILFVEDEPILGETITEVLGMFGYSVDWCKSIADFMEVVADSAGNYDLILSDFHFPDGDFKEIYSEIKSHTGLSNIPLVVSSATAAEADIEYIKGNNLEFLPKPFGIMDLKELVEAHRVKQIKD